MTRPAIVDADYVLNERALRTMLAGLGANEIDHHGRPPAYFGIMKWATRAFERGSAA